MNQMERNEQDYRAALDCLRFSNEAKERMMKNLTNEQEREQAPAKRRSFHPLRTGLIAACLCLALVGTAFAAATVYQQLTAQLYEEDYWGEQFRGYHIYGEPVTYPMEDFTQRLQDDFAAWDHPSILFNQHFDTWEEAKAYLGDNIPAVWPSMDCFIDADEYRVAANYEPYGDGKVKRVDVYHNARVNNCMSCSTEIYIYTPDYTGEILAGAGWPADWEERQAQILDSYTMANGCEAKIVMVSEHFEKSEHYEEGDMRYCTGVFMREGLVYDVRLVAYMNCTLDDAGVEAQLHQILDSFQ